MSDRHEQSRVEFTTDSMFAVFFRGVQLRGQWPDRATAERILDLCERDYHAGKNMDEVLDVWSKWPRSEAEDAETEGGVGFNP